MAFYAVAVPLFPKIFPGGLPHWFRPLFNPGESVSDADIEKDAWLGPHDKVIHVNDHMVVVVTPAYSSGFAVQDRSDVPPPPSPVYSIVGINNPGKGQIAVTYIVQIEMPSTQDYPIDVLLKLNEQQIEVALSNRALNN